MQAQILPDDGRTPNHPSWPFLLVHSETAAADPDPAAWFERTFTGNGWSGTWRWGVYPFPHFHTNTHEVLGVSRGTALLRLGGEAGRDFPVGPGDVLVLPAGTGHQCLEASDDFEVVGAYPGGAEPDLVKPPARPGDRERIVAVPRPDRDPLQGGGGALAEHWR